MVCCLLQDREPGAYEAIWLQKNGKEFRLVQNNTLNDLNIFQLKISNLPVLVRVKNDRKYELPITKNTKKKPLYFGADLGSLNLELDFSEDGDWFLEILFKKIPKSFLES